MEVIEGIGDSLWNAKALVGLAPDKRAATLSIEEPLSSLLMNSSTYHEAHSLIHKAPHHGSRRRSKSGHAREYPFRS